MGGANVTLGRVEVCINNAWGTVCNNHYGTREATVICRQLGFDTLSEYKMICACVYSCNCNHMNIIIDIVSIKRASTAFGVGTGPIFLDNLACNSDDSNLLECPHNTLHQCQHSDEAGVQCYGNN